MGDGWKRRSVVLVALAAMVFILASCGMGTTLDADQIGLHSARLNGFVSSTVVGETSWYFEYGTTLPYDSTTPVETVHVAEANVNYPVSATISGLDEGTFYYYRICASDADGKGSCGANRSVLTDKTVTWDAVNGTGFVVDDTTSGVKIGGMLWTREVYDPEYGYGYLEVYDGSTTLHQGEATCIAVSGNRASMGFPAWGGEGSFVVFVEDNGPTGDRFGIVQVGAPPATCPVPTAANFPDLSVGSAVISPVLTSGDFVVHDAP